MAFNPNEHLRQIKSSQGSQDYLDVKWRLVWFRQQCPGGTIDTEELEYDLDRPVEAEVFEWNPEKRRSEKINKKAKGYARYRAVVTDGKGGRATGTKSENAAAFGDFGEKAETGSIGRALAALGYGTQFVGDEMDEGHRIVDAPVERQAARAQSNGHQAAAIQEADPNAKATKPQLESINKLAQKLGKAVDAPTTFSQAKELLRQLSAEYNESRKAKSN